VWPMTDARPVDTPTPETTPSEAPGGSSGASSDDPSEGPGNQVGPTLAEIEAAADLLRDVAVHTPMEESRWLSKIAGGPVFLKAENLQRAGSFKIRGAYVRMARLSPEERARGVVAASAGNHAQGVALAAQMLGIRAVVYMPHGAPIVKEKATRGYGAEVRFHGATVDEALVEARSWADETGAVLVHPFDHEDIVVGQATCGLEILEQCPEVRTIVVPTGGGGLLAGIAAGVKPQRPDVRVVGVQAAGAAAYPPSLEQGSPQALASMATMADGIAIGRPGDVPFASVLAHVDEFATVDEESLSQALLLLMERAKLVVEPAGAAAVAAVLENPARFETPMVVVLSGGNIDPILLMNVIRHGMATSGRYLALAVRIPDRPGGLATLLADLASVQANVLDVVHQRTSSHLHIGEVEVALQLETRGPEHAEQVRTHLRGAGYPVTEEPSAAQER
jgi:threonine dehydratase